MSISQGLGDDVFFAPAIFLNAAGHSEKLQRYNIGPDPQTCRLSNGLRGMQGRWSAQRGRVKPECLPANVNSKSKVLVIVKLTDVGKARIMTVDGKQEAASRQEPRCSVVGLAHVYRQPTQPWS